MHRQSSRQVLNRLLIARAELIFQRSPGIVQSAFLQAGKAHVTAQVTPLITELGRTRMEVNTKVKAGFSNKLFALNVVITIPVPDTTAKADLQTSIGERIW